MYTWQAELCRAGQSRRGGPAASNQSKHEFSDGDVAAAERKVHHEGPRRFLLFSSVVKPAPYSSRRRRRCSSFTSFLPALLFLSWLV